MGGFHVMYRRIWIVTTLGLIEEEEGERIVHSVERHSFLCYVTDRQFLIEPARPFYLKSRHFLFCFHLLLLLLVFPPFLLYFTLVIFFSLTLKYQSVSFFFFFNNDTRSL